MTLLNDDSLARLDRWASIFAKVAIPLVIALAGWWVQKSMSAEGIRKDYVQMALGILSDPSKQKDGDLREWAVKVLDRNSPVPFSPGLRAQFFKGQATFPAIGASKPIPAPEASLMAALEKLEPLPPEGKGVSAREMRNFSACSAISARLEGLQAWARSVPQRQEFAVIPFESIRVVPREEAERVRGAKHPAGK